MRNEMVTFNEMVEVHMRDNGFSPLAAHFGNPDVFVREFHKEGQLAVVTSSWREIKMNSASFDRMSELVKARVRNAIVAARAVNAAFKEGRDLV
jgi:hypothetical protein